jgi:hypothetical protein
MINPIEYFKQVRHLTNLTYRLEDEMNELYQELKKIRKDVDRLKK